MTAENTENGITRIDRLCSEIQLFDLCDLESCRYKNGRFCTDEKLLARFEAIKEEDDRPALLYDETEEEDDSTDFDEFDEDEFEEE
jgi:hypothetical protein